MEISKLKAENENILKNLKEFTDKTEKLQASLTMRETENSDLLSEMRELNEAILEDTRNQSAQYQESLKSQRLQIETLKNCYKKQIEDLEKKHSEEIEEFKKRDSKENRLASRIAPFGGPTKITDEQKIDLILMEREDGEGSESSSVVPKRRISTTKRSRRDVIPLEELLNSSLDENQIDEDNRSISPTLELQTNGRLLRRRRNYRVRGRRCCC